MKTTEQLHELLSVAENATPGAWTHYHAKLRPRFSTVVDEIQAGTQTVVAWSGFDGLDFDSEQVAANCDHIAAFDPTTCAELVRRLMSVEKELTEVRACDKCDLCEDHYE